LPSFTDCRKYLPQQRIRSRAGTVAREILQARTIRYGVETLRQVSTLFISGNIMESSKLDEKSKRTYSFFEKEEVG